MNENELKNKEFYGFADNITVTTLDKLREMLTCEASNKIYVGDTLTDVVEEVVRREGTFYTGVEAKPLVPWKMTYTDVCVAKIKYLDTETRPQNPGFAEFDWILLHEIQYEYGVYLQQQISASNLKLEDIKPRQRGNLTRV